LAKAIRKDQDSSPNLALGFSLLENGDVDTSLPQRACGGNTADPAAHNGGAKVSSSPRLVFHLNLSSLETQDAQVPERHSRRIVSLSLTPPQLRVSAFGTLFCAQVAPHPANARVQHWPIRHAIRNDRHLPNPVGAQVGVAPVNPTTRPSF
jgi:hypothetical protein